MAITGVRRAFRALPVFGLLVTAATLATPAAGASAATARQYGVAVFVTDTCPRPAADWQTLATNEMNGIKSLGANSVALAFPFYTTSIKANSVSVSNVCPVPTPARNSPSPARLAVLVQTAHNVGLRVVLRPLLDEANLPKWRGAITPTHPKAWIASYENMLRPYFQMANAKKVEQFGIVGELNSIQNNKNWPSFVKFARRLYAGKLLVTPTWPYGPGRHVAGTTFGVDAYPRFPDAKPAAPVAQLLAGWNARLKSSPLPRGVTLYEVGINALDGAYKFPSARGTGAFDQQIQVRWFTAACQFVKAHKMGGIYFWGEWFDANGGRLLTQPNPSAASQFQPNTLSAIRACFKH